MILRIYQLARRWLVEPRLTPAQMHGYLGHHLPATRHAVIVLMALSMASSLLLQRIDPGQGIHHGRLNTFSISAIMVALLTWLAMLRLKSANSFAIASVCFLLTYCVFVGTLTAGSGDALIYMLPQFLSWPLVIAPLALRVRTYATAMATTFITVIVMLGIAQLPLWRSVIALTYVLVMGSISTMAFAFSTRLRKQSFLMNDEMRRLAFQDTLTGLSTRRHFIDVATHALARAQTDGLPSVVCFFDLDHFKQINDGHGHAIGDLAIHETGRVLHECTAQHGIAPALAARLGGEEFAVLLPGTSCATGELFATTVLGKIRALDIQGLHVTASSGLAENLKNETLERLLHRADLALLQAKRMGRNRVERWTETCGVSLPPAVIQVS